MTTEFIWQLPTSGDGRYGNAESTRRGERTTPGHVPFTEGVSDPRGDRFNYFDYLHQVARAADLTGFDGVLVQHDLEGDESWIAAAYLARGTRRVRLIAGFDASWGSAVYAAKNAVSFQRASGGRFAWQIGQGPDAATRRRHADNVDDGDVLARIDELVTVARGVQTGAPFDFKGRFFEVQGGGFRGPLAGNPLPPVYLGGDSEAAFALSARQADVHVLDAAPLEQLRPAIARLQALAAEQGRPLSIGLRIDVLARESAEEAVRDAETYWAQTGRGAEDPAGFADSQFWEDFATRRTGARGALVGSYGQVEQRLAEYAEAGISSFVLGATPHLEEAYRFGEHVLPRLRARLNQDRQAA
ncbi:LLM class flavin-dependent oxidoreductase [Massilia niastensis]|uniref:LLM class flavin-dependent oxidoreductase n=1 Tax=Massilia niastensis TaxID=544911 RepID=UPI00037BDB5D|nr:LLM class flavin-dependent oxidoreductase [Massilia niastensis]